MAKTAKKKKSTLRANGRNLSATSATEGASSSSRERQAPSSGITLRPYQSTARQKFYEGKRRQIRIWHRRAGKDIEALDFASELAQKEVGTYWHLYPTHTQARRAIWNGIDARAQVRFLERAFPASIRKSTLKQDMTIELNNGSIWQLCGSDRYDSLVGSNPRLVVFSEWALCDPRAWDYVRPILRENGGGVIFITTYRGRNHAYRMAQRLKNHPDWFVDIRTVEDTTDNDGNRIISDADIADERSEGTSEALIQQEYFCNPAAAREGAIYGKALEDILDSRVGSYGYDPLRPVIGAWSTNFPDQYSVIFLQEFGTAWRVIGSAYYKMTSLSDALSDALTRFPWKYISRHVVSNGTAVEDVDVFDNYSQTVEVAPDVDNVYQVTREKLNQCYIDTAPRVFTGEQDNNELLLDSLGGYRFQQNQSGQGYSNRPVISWERHYAAAVESYAAWRYLETGTGDGWFRKPDYSQQDRAVI